MARRSPDARVEDEREQRGLHAGEMMRPLREFCLFRPHRHGGDASPVVVKERRFSPNLKRDMGGDAYRQPIEQDVGNFAAPRTERRTDDCPAVGAQRRN